MPEVKFKRPEREPKPDAEIIAQLQRENFQLLAHVDSLREILENERQYYGTRVAELEKNLERIVKVVEGMEKS